MLIHSFARNVFFSGLDFRFISIFCELTVSVFLINGSQYDVYGNLFGLLAAHPVAPLVTMHHLDVVEPIFPNATRVQALQRLLVPVKLDSAESCNNPSAMTSQRVGPFLFLGDLLFKFSEEYFHPVRWKCLHEHF